VVRIIQRQANEALLARAIALPDIENSFIRACTVIRLSGFEVTRLSGTVNSANPSLLALDQGLAVVTRTHS
jgi:hypothetical protein